MARRRQHVEGSLYQRTSDGRWIATVHLGWDERGHRIRRVFTGTSPKAAKDKRDDFLAKRRDGFTMPKGRPPTVAEWLAHWLVKIAKPAVAPTTWAGYRSKVELHIAPFFARLPLLELGEEDIEAFHAHMLARGAAPATVAQMHRILSRSLKVAVARGRIARNPCSNVSPPAIDRAEPQPPTAAETARIVARCADWPGGARWLLAITTGIRQGEALALRWPDVTLTGTPMISVRRSAYRVDRELGYKAPKSRKSRRDIQIGAAMVAALRKHRREQVASLDGLVFTDGKGRPVYPRADYSDWHALLDDLGIRHYRVHDLRHGAATALLEAGMDIRVVQEIMGHATPGFTQAVYQHVRPVLHQRAADAMNNILGGR
jgi:integrase